MTPKVLPPKPRAARPARPARAAGPAQVGNDGYDHDFWRLKLYVAGQTARSTAALSNLRSLCETYLHGKYLIEVVDLLVNPQLAKGDQIIAVPTLVRQLPPPVKKIIGDLSNTERVLVGLDLQPVARRSP